MKKNNSGITLLALVIIVIVLIIIASISVYEGRELIAKSRVQTLETNMLLIQAKAKSYAEEIDAKIWTESDSKKDELRNRAFKDDKKFSDPVTVEQKYLDQISDEIKNNYIAYTITDEALKNMSLEDIKNESYIVIYNKEDFNKIDIIYADGVKYKGNNYFTLSELKKVLSSESNN